MSMPKSKRACVLGVFTGVYRVCKDGVYHQGKVTVKIRCGRWDCPYCGPKKAKRVWKRAFHGKIAQDMKQWGASNYNMKLLTLTYGGSPKRRTSTPLQAAKEMEHGWQKLRKEIRYLYGSFDFIKVRETHQDGWPHLHVLLSGPAIAPREVLDKISRLWRFRYGFGFVRLNWCSTPEKALKYVLKYLFKCPVQLTGVRLFSASKQALEKVWEKPPRVWEEQGVSWMESAETYRQADELLSSLGVEECLVEVEMMPVPGCPF